MSRPFKLRAVLRYLDRDLFSAYLKKIGVKEALPEPSKTQEESEAWDEFIQGLPSEIVKDIETNLRDVNEMATEDGILACLEIAEQAGIHPQKGIETLVGPHDQALFFFLNHPKVFEDASLLHHVTDLKAKVERYLRKRSAEVVLKRAENLAGALSNFLVSADGRGRECKVNIFQNDDRVCFIAYPEDFAKAPLCYEGSRLKKYPIRPTFEIVFVYYPLTGKVELSAKGGPKRLMELFGIFNRVVLEDGKEIPEREKTNRLEKFLDGDLKLPTLAEDAVEYVRLQKLRLSHKYDDYRITLDLRQANGLESMRHTLEKMKLPLSAYNVLQAEIKMKFPGKGRKGGVTILLSNPDKCNLNDSPLHLKAKNYLEEWGLVNRTPTQEPSQRSRRESSTATV